MSRNWKATNSEQEIQYITLQIAELWLNQIRLDRRLDNVQRRLGAEQHDDPGPRRGTRNRRAVRADNNRDRSRVNTSVVNEVEVTRGRVRKQTELEYTTTIVPQIGDRVRIINPRRGQCPRGTVQGFCADDKLKIFTDNGSVVTRMAKNVRLQTINVYDATGYSQHEDGYEWI